MEGVRKVGRNFEIRLAAGQVLEGTLQRPGKIPPEPGDAARELAIPKFIRPNTLPLRFGADSNGQNRFLGDMARASVFNRELSPEEVKRTLG